MTALFFAVMAPVALAGDHDGGEGLWGETNDQVVTYAGFILIVGFPVLILIFRPHGLLGGEIGKARV